MNTHDVIAWILHLHPEIHKISLAEFGQKRDLKKDSIDWNSDYEDLYQDALKLRKYFNIPFWHSIMSSIIDAGVAIDNILEVASLHNNSEIRLLNAIDFNSIDIENQRLAINSKVIIKDGTCLHIPMVDFRIPKSEFNLKIVHKICDMLNPKKDGYILDSGNSYHYIGTNLLTDEEFRKVLSKSLFYSTIVDDTWVAHQLIDGSCNLRLCKKNNVYPIVVKKISPSV